jgi:hypothetical protein
MDEIFHDTTEEEREAAKMRHPSFGGTPAEADDLALDPWW